MNIENIDHIGIRVADLDRAMAFYELFGFKVVHKADNDPVAVVKNADDVELNLVFNANDDNGGENILMDIPTKYPGFTHVAFRVPCGLPRKFNSGNRRDPSDEQHKYHAGSRKIRARWTCLGLCP